METPSPDDRDTLICQLQERLKELECICAISDIAYNPKIPFEHILQDITDTIPPAFRDPEHTCACVTINNTVTKTANFRPCQWRIDSTIMADIRAIGTLEVGYFGTQSLDGPPFLEEEKKLLEVIAARIGIIVHNDTLRAAFDQSEEHFRTLVDDASVGIAQSNLAGELLYANTACMHIFHYESMEEAKGAVPLSRYRNPEDRNVLIEILAQTGKVSDFEVEYVAKTGESIFILLSAVLEGDLITVMMMDITESKKADNKIRELRDGLEAENVNLHEHMEDSGRYGDIIGRSDAMQSMIRRAHQVAGTKTTVLLTGETGTGKNILARFIHRLSDRKDKPFVNVNCAGLPANLIESELFGREKGAFTGSTTRQIGRFELANMGTIFLDEIAELPPDLQSKLLKVIDEGEFERLGSPYTVKVDVRIIASTNRSLIEEIKSGRFREDLYFRLNVFPVSIPPLRERKGDIPLLAKAYTTRFGKTYDKGIMTIPARTMELLEQYTWPGNVRELINVIERAIIVSEDSELRLPDNMVAPFTFDKSSGNTEEQTTGNIVKVEREHILQALQKVGWKIEGPRGAAAYLGLHPSTLRGRMKKLGIIRPRVDGNKE